MPEGKKVEIEFDVREKKFVALVLGGVSVEKALKKAGMGKSELLRGKVVDHIFTHFGRLGLKWKVLVEKGKACLESIMDDPKEKGATKVQAVKVIMWTLLQVSPGLLKEEEELGTRDEAADKVLGSVVSFGSDKIN